MYWCLNCFVRSHKARSLPFVPWEQRPHCVAPPVCLVYLHHSGQLHLNNLHDMNHAASRASTRDLTVRQKWFVVLVLQFFHQSSTSAVFSQWHQRSRWLYHINHPACCIFNGSVLLRRLDVLPRSPPCFFLFFWQCKSVSSDRLQAPYFI